MKNILQFLRTTLVGGILFLVPIVVLVIVLGKALGLAHKLVDPLAEHIPVHSVIGLRTPVLLAISAIVFFSFLAGFVARTKLAQKIINGLEAAVLSNVPGYQSSKAWARACWGSRNMGLIQSCWHASTTSGNSPSASPFWTTISSRFSSRARQIRSPATSTS